MTYYKIFSFQDDKAVKGYHSLQECATDMNVTALKMYDIINDRRKLNGMTFRMADDIADAVLDKIYGEIDNKDCE